MRKSWKGDWKRFTKLFENYISSKKLTFYWRKNMSENNFILLCCMWSKFWSAAGRKAYTANIKMIKTLDSLFLTENLLKLHLRLSKLSTVYRRSQNYRSTSLHKYEVKLFSATFLEPKKWYFEIKSSLFR